jgi:hypothetical protein
MDAPAHPRWLSLVISLSGRRGTARMRVWRALKGIGAAVLRDGVYLLPEGDAGRRAFDELARLIEAAGGSAHVLALDQLPREQDEAFRRLFDRSDQYARLIARLQKLRPTLARRRRPESARGIRQLRREYESLHATDYFPGAPAAQAAELLAEIEAVLAARESPDEPHAHAGAIPPRDPRQYRSRTWATRARPWVDRLASAWLIKRFIDPKARFLWLRDAKRCPKHALGFDFDGATFTHVGSRVTFETLLASFGLESDAALVRIGGLVHCLDVGGAPVPEAQGLAAILAGTRSRFRRDDALLAEASRVFDSLYTAFLEE